MCSLHLHRNLLMSMVVWPLLLGAIGCDGKPSPSARQKERGPIEKFALIVSAVKSDLEGETSLPAVGFGNRSNELTAQNTQRTVIEELMEPTDATQMYTGRITIESKTTYSSSSRPTDDDQPEEDNGKPRGLSFGSLDETDDADLFSASPGSENELAEGRLSKPRSKHSPGSSSDPLVIRGFDNEWTKTFDLAYEGGRWVLKTEIEDDGIYAVFEAALQKQ